MATVKYIGVGNSKREKRVSDDFSLGKYVFETCQTINGGQCAVSASAANERRISEMLELDYDRTAKGVFVPGTYFRDLTTFSGSSGGYAVPELLDEHNFIQALVPYSSVLQAGARVAVYRNGNRKIFGISNPVQVYWVQENNSPSDSIDPVFGALAMEPHTLVATINISRQLQVQGAWEIDQVAKRELLRAIGLEVDRISLVGLGAENEPMGIANNPLVPTSDMGTASYDNVCDLIGSIDDSNANLNGLSFITDSKVKKYMLKNFRNPSSGDTPIWQGVPDLDFYCTNNLGSSSNPHTAITGDFSQLVIGQWRGIDVIVNPFTFATNGTVQLVAFLTVDIGVLHPESFVVAKGVAV